MQVLGMARALFLLCVLLCGFAGPTAAESCKALMQSIDLYDGGVSAAIDDEPEDLPKELDRRLRALKSGDAAQALRISKKIRRGLTDLRTISPPASVIRLHRALIEYYAAGSRVLDAQDTGDEVWRRSAEIETWEGLEAFFVSMRDLWVEHGCAEGEVEALEEHYIPTVAKQISQLRETAAEPLVVPPASP